MVHDEHLHGERLRPQIGRLRVLVHARPEPAILVLVADDVLQVSLDPGLQARVVQEPGQRDGTVEPVGHALPTFCVAAYPGALLDVGPELIQMAAEAVYLNAKLSCQPAARRDGLQGERAKRRSLEAHSGYSQKFV